METLKIFITKDNINKIKGVDSFSRVINTLIEYTDLEDIEKYLQQKYSSGVYNDKNNETKTHNKQKT